MPPDRKNFTLTLAEVVNLFLEDCELRRLTPRTRGRYAWQMQRFVDWAAGEGATKLADFTPALAKGYAFELNRHKTPAGRPMAASTIRTHLSTCKNLFHFLAVEGLIDDNPFSRVRLPRLPKKILDALDLDELERVLRACDTPRDKAIIAFLADTGVRAEELCKLRIVDIDLKSGAVRVSGKGQKERLVYAGTTARRYLRRYLLTRPRASPESALFASFRLHENKRRPTQESRMTPNGLLQLMRRLRVASGVRVLSCHALRRTFAVTCLRNGMNVYVLARLMGHSDISVLRYYLALVEGDIEEGHHKYGPMDHLKSNQERQFVAARP